MSSAIQELLNTTLCLPENDRADLAVSLIESLDQPFDADAQPAWADEIGRRIADLDKGTVKPIPRDEARRTIGGNA